MTEDTQTRIAQMLADVEVVKRYLATVGASRDLGEYASGRLDHRSAVLKSLIQDTEQNS